MGESKPVRIARTAGAAALIAASLTVLTSCSTLGLTAGSPVASSSADVVDPSVASASATPTETVASDTPAPVVTPSASPTATSAADSRTAVVPFITTADWDPSAKALDVSAIVPEIVEGGGTCTITVASGSATRTATAKGVAASSYTGCEAVAISGLASGSYTVRVRYSSDHATGASAARTVQVG